MMVTGLREWVGLFSNLDINSSKESCESKRKVFNFDLSSHKEHNLLASFGWFSRFHSLVSWCEGPQATVQHSKTQ